jgi:3-hydroxyacyl-CoA dehydrogenase
MSERNPVGVLGAGTMGHGIAQLFATKGKDVILADTSSASLQAAERQIRENLDYMVEIGYLSPGEADAAAGRISYTTELGDMASKARFITEAVSENLELKQDLFRQLDELAEESVILASNTSSFDITELSQKVVRKGRVIGTHWFYPPQITPCVEVIPSAHTDKAVVDETMALLDAAGKAPTVCKSSPASSPTASSTRSSPRRSPSWTRGSRPRSRWTGSSRPPSVSA